MKILVTGVNGLVGNSIIKILSKSEHEVFKSSRRIEGLADHKVDITLKDDLAASLLLWKSIEEKTFYK